jgi:hypothetical protein
MALGFGAAAVTRAARAEGTPNTVPRRDPVSIDIRSSYPRLPIELHYGESAAGTVQPFLRCETPCSARVGLPAAIVGFAKYGATSKPDIWVDSRTPGR